MQAILMAAGVGNRISGSINCPKSTLEVDGKPLIRRTVEMLLNNDIKVSIVVGYMKDAIVKTLEGLDVNYYYNPFFQVTNSMGSLWFAREALENDEDTILGNADVFWQEDILDLLINNSHDAVMLADKSRVDVGDYFFRTQDGIIVAYGKELKREERDCEYVGLARLKAGFIEGFKKRVDNCVSRELYDLWWENVLYIYSGEYPVHVQDVDGRFWGEIDYVSDYNRILEHFGLPDFKSENSVPLK